MERGGRGGGGEKDRLEEIGGRGGRLMYGGGC